MCGQAAVFDSTEPVEGESMTRLQGQEGSHHRRGSGIGRLMALRRSGAGAQVVAWDIDAESGGH